MSYQLINEALKDIPDLRYSHNKFNRVTKEIREDEYNETTEVYSLGEDDLHIKIVLRSDSYGDNESVHSVQIVKPVVKQVTDFETV